MAAKKKIYAEVAPAVPLPTTGPQTYTYEVPSDKNITAELFTQVRIPLGRRFVSGVVVKLHNKKSKFQTKELALHSQWQLTAHQIAFARWIALTMQGGLGYTLRLFFPSVRLSRTHFKDRRSSNRLHNLTLSPRASVTPLHLAVIHGDKAERGIELMQLVQKVVKRQKQVLILIPEKALAHRFQSLLRAINVTGIVVDSALSDSIYSDTWYKVQNGASNVIIGTQKALCLPWLNLGLIIVENESYGTHKLWEQYPRLDNRYAARELARIHRCSLVYSGSVSSLDLQHRLRTGEVTSLVDKPLAYKIKVLTSTFDDRRNHYLLPTEALTLLKSWLAQRDHIFIFHNRKGTWSTVLCTKCKHTLSCPNCDVALTVHGEKGQRLACHHCGHTVDMPKQCPYCQNKHLRLFGPGTEKIATILRRQLPKANVIELNADTLRAHAVVQLRQKLRGKKSTLFIGTTAAFRVLSAIEINRVLFLRPESMLLYPDFRSSERTRTTLFRLQEILPNKRQVVIATRLKRLVDETLALSNHDFSESELKHRRQLSYPPYTDLIRLTCSGKTKQAAELKAVAVRDRLEKKRTTKVSIRGPFVSYVKKRRGKHEAHLILSGSLKDLTSLYQNIPVDTVDLNPERIL